MGLKEEYEKRKKLLIELQEKCFEALKEVVKEIEGYPRGFGRTVAFYQALEDKGVFILIDNIQILMRQLKEIKYLLDRGYK